MARMQWRWLFPRPCGAVVGLLTLALSACGAAPASAPATAASTAAPLATSATASAATTALASTVAATSSAAATVQVRIDPKLGTIMVDSNGMTLYKYAKDGANTSACTDACAKAWPPLTAAGAPSLPSDVHGTLATFARADGTAQVSFNGVPLYRFAKDQHPGDVTGEGVGGVWSAANVANTRSAPAVAPGTRVSGAIQTIADNKVMLQDGASFAVASSTQISRVVSASLGDLRPGDYVAVTAMRQPDDSLKATVVNIFPAAARGAANGQFPMTGGNLMTNAAIAKVSASGFTVSFPGGGENVTLASDARITRSVAAQQSALTPGARITAAVRDGVAQSITVQ